MQRIIQYLVCDLGVDKNTAVTVVLTLLTFALGYIVSWINSAVANYRLRRNYRRIFKDLMNTIGLNLEYQSKLFLQAHNTATITNEGNYSFKKNTITHLDNVDKLEFKDIYNSYLTGIENLCGTKKKLKAFNKIYGRLSLLRTIDSNLFPEISRWDDRYHDNEQRWNTAIEEMRQIVDEIHARYDDQTLPMRFAEYIQEMDRIIYAWQQMPDRSQHHNVRHHYIDLLLAHNHAFQNEPFEGTGIILKTNTILLNAQHHYDNMEATLAVLAEGFLSNHHIFRASKKILALSVKILN